MIDHVTIRVSDVEKSKEFYEQAFASLNYTVAFGEKGVFWAFDIGDGLFEITQNDGEVTTPVHIALRMKNREAVDIFHEAACEAGATDNGAPGPRPEYTKNYYACFVLDPDNHNIEAIHDA